MRCVVLYAPHLGRDLSALLAPLPMSSVVIQTGQPTPRGEDGCLESHKTAIREARDRGDRRVFVMEDDCAFTPAFDWDRWNEDAEWAESHGYDVMAGGCTRTYDEKVVRDGMVEVSAFHSAHCVVYFKSGYERALRAVQPYDVSLGATCDLRCVLTWPFVAVQRPSFSGILCEPVNYVPLYQAHETRLGHALGMLTPFQAMAEY